MEEERGKEMGREAEREKKMRKQREREEGRGRREKDLGDSKRKEGQREKPEAELHRVGTSALLTQALHFLKVIHPLEDLIQIKQEKQD